MNSCPPNYSLRRAQAACFELFFKTPGLEICPPVYEVKIFLGHCRCCQGIVCVRPKDSKNPSKLEWDGGGAIMVMVAHWEHCQLWWRRPNLTTGHLVIPLPLAYLFPLSISYLQHLTLKQIVIVHGSIPFKLGEKMQLSHQAFYFAQPKNPPKLSFVNSCL